MYHRLVLFKERMYYRTDSSTGKCEKGSIPDSYKWRPFGIPKNATYRGLLNIGAPGESVLAAEYDIPVAQHPYNCKLIHTHTHKKKSIHTCIVVWFLFL